MNAKKNNPEFNKEKIFNQHYLGLKPFPTRVMYSGGQDKGFKIKPLESGIGKPKLINLIQKRNNYKLPGRGNVLPLLGTWIIFTSGFQLLYRQKSRMEYLQEKEFRSIFLGLVLGIPVEPDAFELINKLLAVYQKECPSHPLTTILVEGQN